MVREEGETGNRSPQYTEVPAPKRKESAGTGNAEKPDALFSPRFRSVAAMAGWDEEALLIASLVVEDTPDRDTKQKRRSNLVHFKTPPTNSRRKRRAQRRSPVTIPVAVLDLDEDDETLKEEDRAKKSPEESVEGEEKKRENDDGSKEPEKSNTASSTPTLPCIDKLREELSCAICLEICFEPSTTPCGHSFCRKCLRSAADKCGKRCPKCRQFISNNSRVGTVNTVLWNTIQLLFPQEIEARKAAATVNDHESEHQTPARESHNGRYRAVRALNSRNPDYFDNESPHRRRNNLSRGNRRSVPPSGGISATRRRREELPSQDEDAALALRLQREEFIGAFRESRDQQHRSSVALARANLRAMASRAMNIRVRGLQI